MLQLEIENRRAASPKRGGEGLVIERGRRPRGGAIGLAVGILERAWCPNPGGRSVPVISISERGKSKWRNLFQRLSVKNGKGRSTAREEREVWDPKRIFFPVWSCLWTVVI